MIRNGQATVWGRLLPKNHVAAALPIQNVPNLFECIDDLTS
jgi:hypothetical protein